MDLTCQHRVTDAIMPHTLTRGDGMQEQLMELAAEGLSASKIATIVGISVGAVTKFLAQDGIASKIEQLKLLPKAVKVDNQYDRIEVKALTALEETISMQEAPVIIKVLELMQKKKAGQAPVPSTNQTINFINVTIPERLIPQADVNEVTINDQGEIVAIQDRNFAALPTDSLQEKFLKLKMDKAAAAKIEHTDVVFAEDL